MITEYVTFLVVGITQGCLRYMSIFASSHSWMTLARMARILHYLFIFIFSLLQSDGCWEEQPAVAKSCNKDATV